MRRVVILTLMVCAAGTFAQEASQTPRQALMEMFFSKQPGTFLKHLPAVTRAALEKSGATTTLQQYSALTTQQNTFQKFETGPVMFSAIDAKTGQKVEVVIDQESQHGDQDDIELSIHTYKNGEAQRTPFMPRLVFSMKTEAGAWALNEIAITIKLPLADPDLLKSFADGMNKAKLAAASGVQQTQVRPIGQQPSGQMSVNAFGSEANVLAVMHKILVAETTYAATYSVVGYTCSLSDLDGFGAAEPNQHQAMLISSGLASGKNQGYTFSLSGCAGPPATSFRLTATPMQHGYGQRAFCADQSGTIRASDAGSVASCGSSGTPVP